MFISRKEYKELENRVALLEITVKRLVDELEILKEENKQPSYLG
ncbi:hypothetical protein PJ311_18420 [Bacillus sp. CLL-7-23]|uniref:Uncharacterized protein n=1 Tax=Bacillus changyiensis TaxID=3004103 RepID=A0ABT4X895_9BACI|nr:hypothetical protein [Bacillus changyiensis]MDA1477275.1 hypothetical protein [Bacillus changyiensis]MDA7028517.1 hypothetical protein [Bacillus changyiensis]